MSGGRCPGERVPRATTAGGFTLLEVLAALALAALGLAAMATTVASGSRTAIGLSERTVATWVASNHLAALVLEDDGSAGAWQGAVEMGGRRWFIERDVETTADPDLKKVTVDVFVDPERRARAVRQIGFLARFDAPLGAP